MIEKESNPMDLENLQIQKTKREIEKIDVEILAQKNAVRRGWLNTISISVGIALSLFGVYKIYNDMANRNRQLIIESEIRSHEIFLNQVLDRISGVKVQGFELDENNEFRETYRELYGEATQLGAYVAAVTLSNKFSVLRPLAIEVLEHQIKVDPKAAEFLAKLKYMDEK